MGDYAWKTAQILDQIRPPQSTGDTSAMVSMITAVGQKPQGSVTSAQLVTQKQQDLSKAVQRS